MTGAMNDDPGERRATAFPGRVRPVCGGPATAATGGALGVAPTTRAYERGPSTPGARTGEHPPTALPCPARPTVCSALSAGAPVIGTMPAGGLVVEVTR